MTVKISFIEAGHTTGPQGAVLPGSPWKSIRFPATVAVIEHPQHGVALFDTGYSPLFHEVTRYLPEKLYALALPVHIEREETALSQLEKRGIRAADVRKVILSHFHADHVAGVSDFTSAQYVYSAPAYDKLKHLGRIGSVKAGFLRGLLPGDFESRSRPVSAAEFSLPADLSHGLGRGYDVFGDGSAVLVPLPGHAPGHSGLVVRARREDSGKETTYLLAGDAAWVSESYEQDRPPNPVARLIFEDWSEYKSTLHRLHAFHLANPGVEIVPCHCETKGRKLREAIGPTLRTTS